MRPLKTAGMAEVASLRARTRRLFALGRINRPDYKYIDVRLDQIEARIVSMKETNEYGEEEV